MVRKLNIDDAAGKIALATCVFGQPLPSAYRDYFNLEAEYLIRQLARELRGGFISYRFGGTLHSLDHRWRSADQDLCVLRWRRELGL